jgi:hypothetical protein
MYDLKNDRNNQYGSDGKTEKGNGDVNNRQLQSEDFPLSFEEILQKSCFMLGHDSGAGCCTRAN